MPSVPFAAFGLHPDLLRGIREMGFTRPTPIQQDAIPPALAGRDLLACAMTGSGKTAAFVLPILHQLMGRPRGTTRALVLTPTRELAAQIDQHLHLLAVHTPLTGAAVFGGVDMIAQGHAFSVGVDVLTATPGRLMDHFRFPHGKLAGLEILVLDEADRMLDMGFLPDIERILRHLPPRKQTLFFSATLPPPIVELSKEMLRDPVAINIQRQSEPAVGITQAAYPVPQDLKASLLLTLLKRGDLKYALVFTRTKLRASRLAAQLSQHGVHCESIHGDRDQEQRMAALASFKSGRCRVLVATDIAARGIDVEAVGHVVNFDVPHVADDYIHRVGRTARAGAVGEAFTFVAPDEEEDLAQIERALKKTLPRVTVPGFDYGRRSPHRPGIPMRERGRPREPSGQVGPAGPPAVSPGVPPASPGIWHGTRSGGSGRPRGRRRR